MDYSSRWSQGRVVLIGALVLSQIQGFPWQSPSYAEQKVVPCPPDPQGMPPLPPEELSAKSQCFGETAEIKNNEGWEVVVLYGKSVGRQVFKLKGKSSHLIVMEDCWSMLSVITRNKTAATLPLRPGASYLVRWSEKAGQYVLESERDGIRIVAPD